MIDNRCVGAQLEFLILLKHYEHNDEYKLKGVTIEDYDKFLSPNKNTWQEIGLIKENGRLKDWNTRLRGALSVLKRKGCLKKRFDDDIYYFLGSNFENGIRKRISILTERLEIDIDDEHKYTNDELIELIANNKTPYDVLRSVQDKKLHMFTLDDIVKLAVLYGNYKLENVFRP